MAVETEMATTSASPSPATHSARALSMLDSTLAGSCTCHPARGCSSRYSRRPLASSRWAPLTPKAATLTAVVPTSRPMMTSVIRSVMSQGRYCIRLTKDGIDQLAVSPEARFESIQHCRYGIRKLTRVGCLPSGTGYGVLDRSAQPAQMQNPGADGGGAACGHPARRPLRAERRQRTHGQLGEAVRCDPSQLIAGSR